MNDNTSNQSHNNLHSCSFYQQVFEEPVTEWQNVGGKNLLVIIKLKPAY